MPSSAIFGISWWGNSARVPEGFPHRTFGDCQTWFGRTFGATVLALRTDGGPLVVSPGWDTPVPEGATLYYVAERRIEPARLHAGQAAYVRGLLGA